MAQSSYRPLKLRTGMRGLVLLSITKACFLFPMTHALHCVKTFSDYGQFLYEIGCKGTGDGQLRRPRGLAIDKINNLVVCDSDNKRLQVFSLDGKFLNSVAEETLRPESVSVLKNGDLLFCDLRYFIFLKLNTISPKRKHARKRKRTLGLDQENY